MDDRIQWHLLRYISAAWVRRDPDARPWGLWIVRHAPLSAPDADCIDSSLCAAWFLDRHGVRSWNPWAYARFRAVHSRWRSTIFGPLHEIGLAAFAPYMHSDEVYLEIVWGGLDARGWRVSVDAAHGVTIQRTLWVA